jgi:hypothetical protein
MSKEKNKNTFRVAALLLVACLISSVMLSGTFAKYTSEYAGKDTALVARWDFTVSDGTTYLGAPNADPIQALDLFSYAYATHINQIDGDYIIAPGVEDEFTIVMNFLSDVDAKVTVNFAENENSTAKNLPIEYSVVDDTWVTIDDLPAAFVTALDASERVTNVSGNTFTFTRSGINDTTATTITQVVKWRWAFERGADDTTKAANNAVDTEFGNESAAVAYGARTKYVLDVSVKAEQIAPGVEITGTTQVGATLNASLLIPDGATTTTYQWQISDSLNGPFTDIGGIDDQVTYTLLEDDQGKYIRVLATGTAGSTDTITSAPVGPIAAAPPAEED